MNVQQTASGNSGDRDMRVVVAMSGGVDSSVAAALLARDGHEVIGLSMQLYDHSGRDGEAASASAPAARSTTSTTPGAWPHARHSALHRELRAGVRRDVVSNFVREYSAGRTPIPCVHCNGDLKFATLAERAGGLRRRIRRDRPLRARRARSAPDDYLLKRGRGRVEGSVVLSVHADAGSSSRTRCSRSASWTRPPCASRRATRPAGGREAGQPRDLLRGGRRPRRVRRAARTRPWSGRDPRRQRQGRRHARRRPPIHGRPAQGPRPVVPRSASTSSASMRSRAP